MSTQNPINTAGTVGSNVSVETVDAGPYDDPARWAPRLEALLAEHQTLYESLDTLSERQSALVSAGETQKLLGVLGERQRLIEAITRTSEAIAPFRRSWDGLMAALPESQRAELREQVKSIAQRIDRINERDERDKVALEAQRDVVGKQMDNVVRGKGAVHAYAGNTAHRGPRFQDREG